MMEEDGIMRLPVDINYRILTHISDPASLVCAASSCKLWRDIILGSTFLDGLKMRHLDHGFTSSILLGFFFQDNVDASLGQLYERKMSSLEPSFMPTSEIFTGRKQGCRPLSLGSFIEGFVATLNFYEPVTSQDGFLVLLHCSKATHEFHKPDVVRFCNPLTGEVFHVPDLKMLPPDCYALIVNGDIILDRHMSQSFLLVAVWTTGKKIFYSCYCSETKAWWKPTTSPELMPGLFVRSSSAAASHGRIHWFCGSLKNRMLTHVVTLDVEGEELSYLKLPSEAKGNMLLANSADGDLLLLLLRDLHMSLWKHKCESGSDISDWVLSETVDLTNYLPRRVLMVQSSANVSLEIFRGKSGAVVLWIEGEGLFLFRLNDRSVRKLDRKLDSERVTKKYCFCPYEIEWLPGLAVTNHIVDGSSLLDVDWKKIHGRWRTLMATNTVTNTKWQRERHEVQSGLTAGGMAI